MLLLDRLSILPRTLHVPFSRALQILLLARLAVVGTSLPLLGQPCSAQPAVLPALGVELRRLFLWQAVPCSPFEPAQPLFVSLLEPFAARVALRAVSVVLWLYLGVSV